MTLLLLLLTIAAIALATHSYIAFSKGIDQLLANLKSARVALEKVLIAKGKTNP